MAISSTSFKQGNKAAVKSPKIVIRKFKQMYENCKTDKNILCFEDACNSIGARGSKVDYWVNKLHVFETSTKDIQNTITSRINKGALTGEFNPTASIWRMKQLGERDSQNIDYTSKGERIRPLQLTSETAKAIDKTIDDNI